MSAICILSRTSTQRASTLSTRSAILAAIALVAVTILAQATAEGTDRLWSAVPCAFVYGMSLVLWPWFRPRLAPAICPLNWAHLAFATPLLIMPLLIAATGVEANTLPRLPSQSSMSIANLLVLVAYLSFAVGYRAAIRRRPAGLRNARPGPAAPSLTFIVAVACFGIAGLFLTFHSWAQFAEYYTNPSSRRVFASGQTTVADGLGPLFRPFLAFALIALWLRLLRIKHRSRLGTVLITAACILPAILSQLTNSYNRSSLFVPLVAAAAAYSKDIRRIPLRRLLSWATPCLLLLLLIGEYRNTILTTSDLINDPNAGPQLLQQLNVSRAVQAYGSAPQFAAFLIENTRDMGPLYGRTLLNSLMYPVPVLGKSFREASGVTLYNRLIYGPTPSIDQVIPFVGEVFINLSVPGVCLAFFLLGSVIALMQRKFQLTREPMLSYSLQFISIWLLFLTVGSLAVVSQILIYMCWPIYAYLLWRQIAITRAGRAVRKHFLPLAAFRPINGYPHGA